MLKKVTVFFVKKLIKAGTSVTTQSLATSGSDAGASWQVSYYKDSYTCTVKMTGIAIYGNPSSSNGCASGLIFYYSDGTTYDVGVNLGQTTSVLSFSNPGGLTSVDNYHGGIIDILQLCTSSSCVVAGNTGGRSISTYTTVNTGWTISGFWGSFSSSYGAQNCFSGFGIYYH